METIPWSGLLENRKYMIVFNGPRSERSDYVLHYLIRLREEIWRGDAGDGDTKSLVFLWGLDCVS